MDTGIRSYYSDPRGVIRELEGTRYLVGLIANPSEMSNEDLIRTALKLIDLVEGVVE